MTCPASSQYETIFLLNSDSSMQPVQKLIGLNIKVARTKRSMSQAMVANKLGVEPNYLSRIERGTIGTPPERLYEIIHILKCDLTEIFPQPSEVETQFNRKEQ